MRIIHILKGKANPNTMNGVNKVVHYLATEQLYLGHKVEVWGITANPNRISHQHLYDLKLFSATKFRFRLSNLLHESLSSLPSNNVIVHLHSVFLPELYAVSCLLKKLNISWVLSPHSGYNSTSMQKNKWAKLLYMQFFECKVIKYAKKIQALGCSEVVDINKLGINKNVILIPNGQSPIDAHKIKVTKKQNDMIFGFCGRLATKHKGLDLLIEGFSQYKSQGGNGELWLIGDGPDKSKLIAQANQLEYGKDIKFLGKMFGDLKLHTLLQIDVFVHTSRWEGMPMSVLEAFALGKPVLVSKETNMADCINTYKNGIVLNKNTPDDIACCLFKFKELKDSDNIYSLGNNSKLAIEESLNWQIVASLVVSNLYS
ncbi:MAG: glycosyltransferase [Colwellia sp.]